MKQIYTRTQFNFFKVVAYSVLLIVAAKQSDAQICSNPGSVIYALSNSGAIYPVTVSNGSVGAAVNSTSLGSTSNANAIGYNSVNGIFYYFQNAGSGSQKFVSFNPSTNTYTTLANSPITSIALKGCVNFSGTGYYCLDSQGNLCYYDISSNTWTLICSSFTDQFSNNVSATFTSQSSGDIAIDGLGNMWIVSSSNSSWSLHKLVTPPITSVPSLTVTQLVSPNTATPTGVNFVGIAFDPAGNIYMSTNNDLYVLKQNFSLTHLSSFSTGGICGDLTSCNFPFGILALSFQNVNVKANDNSSVSVSWSVAQQAGTKGYYIEHSTDGSNWGDAGFVAAKEIYSSNAEYDFTDNSPFSGINYYRIHEVDMNDNGNYSEVKTVSLANGFTASTQVWPNPAKDLIRIQNNSSYTMARIYNQSGALVSESKLNGGANTININPLPFGAYIMNIKDQNGNNYNQKFIKD